MKPTTIKEPIIIGKQPISETHEVKLPTSDIDSGQDSILLVRERVRGRKLEGPYKKRKGVLLDQLQHTITYLPAGTGQQPKLSKRDIGKQPTMQLTGGRSAN